MAIQLRDKYVEEIPKEVEDKLKSLHEKFFNEEAQKIFDEYTRNLFPEQIEPIWITRPTYSTTSSTFNGYYNSLSPYNIDTRSTT